MTDSTGLEDYPLLNLPMKGNSNLVENTGKVFKVGTVVNKDMPEGGKIIPTTEKESGPTLKE